MNNDKADAKIKQAVRQAYGVAAVRSVQEPDRASCGCRTCGPPETVAGSGNATTPAPLTVTDLVERPDSVLSFAQLQAGEVVLDLGSGEGIDCLLAARKVGPTGQVIGLDMTPEMIKLARRHAKEIGATNVDFRYGEIEDIPLPDASMDVVISSCVINLSPDKDAVFREVYRVLRPGGRMLVSDIAIDSELPQPIRESLVAWAGCVAGALAESDYVDKVRAAGFVDVQVLSREYVKISESPPWELARAALVEAGLALDTLDHTVVNARIRACKAAQAQCQVCQ